MEEINNHVNAQIQATIEQVEKILRPHMAESYRCTALCFDDASRSSKEVGQCAQTCQEKLSVAQEAFGAEMKAFQERVGRCEADAHDRLRTKFGDTKPAEAVLEAQFVDYLKPCLEERIQGLPTIVERVRTVAGTAAAASAPAAKKAAGGWFSK